MALHVQPPHFVLIPFLAQGHTIPMVDIARMLAECDVIVTIFTTKHNANRFKPLITRAIEKGLQIRVIELDFPAAEAGLPQGCENFDMLPSVANALEFFTATKMLKPQVEEKLKELNPSPTCMISDFCYPWTINIAKTIGIPLLIFHGFCCFSLFIIHSIRKSKDFLDNITSDSEYFEVPNLPDQILVTKAQLGGFSNTTIQEWKELHDEMMSAEDRAYGIVVNTFEELDTNYVREYRKAKGKNVFCIGPVSLCNKEDMDKAQRGKQSSISEQQCLKWLDSWDPNSVIYVCLGSLIRLSTPQMIQLGLGLELSNRPFIWVIGYASEELKKWFLEENFEERNKQKGLIIHGWAPQVVILSHPSIGGFLTHCGWNSSLEAISAGVPMITMPAFAEQFINEKLVVDVLGIGVKSGVEVVVIFGMEENVGVLVKDEDIKRVIDKLMDEGEEGEMRRKRAKEMGILARRAVEEGGSSHANLKHLIQDIMEQANTMKTESKFVKDEDL